jgi:hypothetical protein
LIDNIRDGKDDFDRFISQVESYLDKKRPNQ